MSKIFDLSSISLNPIDEESELIPLMTSDDEEAISRESIPETLPILPLRNTVLFPGVVIPITATRDKSVKLIKQANSGDKLIGVVSQKDGNVSNPTQSDINNIGTVAKILRVLQMPDGNLTIIIQGKKRFNIKNFISEDPFILASVNELIEFKPEKDDKKFNATIDSIKDLALKIINDNPNIPTEASFAIKNIHSNSFLVNFVSSNMNISVGEKYKILEVNSLQKRALSCLKYMNVEFQKLSLKNDIQSKVRTDLDQQQREYFLNQQLKTIQEELGTSSNDEEIEEMKLKAKTMKWNNDVEKHFEKEIKKLQRMNPQVAEYSIQRNYLDLILELPWNEFSEDNFNLKRAKRVLDRDHYGLSDVKRRIIEQIAVLKLKNDLNSPILCFYGPPGVGKTSLGKSIAESLGREYVRISLGGLRDEAEIRGHRKTYIGAMPGRIIQSLKKVKTSNPVFILDEIDKLSVGSQGDPSSAMLEVLDPEQNSEFYDNFLELGFDLSKVLFIATANNLNTIQPALLDRMEIINISGYSAEEKVQIAKKYLLKKQILEHGLLEHKFNLQSDVIKIIIEGYTRESGVRKLEKNIAKICRWIATKIVEDNNSIDSISSENISEILGVPISKALYENNDVVGVTTGLAWTQYGGEILFIESILSPGKGLLSITGNLGKVMKESATIALEFIKSNSSDFGIDSEIFKKYNFHLHVPEGATPKDGPSAGITMLTSLVSLLTQRKVKDKFAMTGEITLRGRVLPVGGIKEKILAAKRANIKQIILSADNKKNVDEIDSKYLRGLKFHYVNFMKDVIEISLIRNKAPNSKKLI
ncbi:MAG: endopeptidase La [Flavobacteriaceae bacterium]|nr:endopeptidase La [Flavobacteriaceae bacterium]MBL6683906.1 endopeptidase La [Flavobacteriaceae bacterium]